MIVTLTLVAILFLVAGWLWVYTLLGMIPKGFWKKQWDRLRGTPSFDHSFNTVSKEWDKKPDAEDEAVFHDVFEMMDEMNVTAVESFKAYGSRTFYFTCKCGQKNRLGTDLSLFRKAGCGKCHKKFTRDASAPGTSATSAPSSTERPN